MQPMWMVRAERGRLYDEFLRHGVAALGWTALARLVAAAGSRQALLDMYAAAEPARRRSAIVSGASQVWRFVHDVAEGDRVVTYSPQRRPSSPDGARGGTTSAAPPLPPRNASRTHLRMAGSPITKKETRPESPGREN